VVETSKSQRYGIGYVLY